MDEHDGPVNPASDPNGQEWKEFLNHILGADAERVIAELQAHGIDPEAMFSGDSLPANPAALSGMLHQIQAMLANPGSGPVNQDVARDMAVQVLNSSGSLTVTASQARQVREALSVAELWLDVATEFTPSGAHSHAWSREEWVEKTLPTFHQLAEPVAKSVTGALTKLLTEQLEQFGGEFGPDAGATPPGFPFNSATDFPGIGGIDPATMLDRIGALAFGMQIGQAVGTLAQEALGSTDIGIPLLSSPGAALVPQNLSEFGAGLGVPAEEVLHFLAVREAAHARLFHGVPWLRGHLLGLVEAYANEVSIDFDSLEQALHSVDPTDPQALQRALSGGVFGVENTAQQRAVLLRLETALALVEGWVSQVTASATLPHLPQAGALAETIARRRATGGPSEQIFATLVGLELRPRRARDAAALWRHIETAGGNPAREAVWAHPDLLPTAGDLDDPAGYLARRVLAQEESAEFDRALEQLLEGEEPTGEL